MAKRVIGVDFVVKNDVNGASRNFMRFHIECPASEGVACRDLAGLTNGLTTAESNRVAANTSDTGAFT